MKVAALDDGILGNCIVSGSDLADTVRQELISRPLQQLAFPLLRGVLLRRTKGLFFDGGDGSYMSRLLQKRELIRR